MNERLSALRKKLGLTQEKFAAQLGLTRNFIWLLEKGERIPSERTIADICREFGADEHWLRTGEGKMFRPVSVDESIASFIGDTLAGDDDFKKAFIAMLATMTDEEWAIVKRKAEVLVHELQKQNKKADPS